MSTLRAVDRAFSILRIVADSPEGVGVNTITRAADLPSSTASRILAAFNLYGPTFRLKDVDKQKNIITTLLAGATNLQKMLS